MPAGPPQRKQCMLSLHAARASLLTWRRRWACLPSMTMQSVAQESRSVHASLHRACTGLPGVPPRGAACDVQREHAVDRPREPLNACCLALCLNRPVWCSVNMQVIVQESRTHDGVSGSLLLMRDADKVSIPS